MLAACPKAVAERERQSKAKYDLKWEKRKLEIYGADFYRALKKIADGANNAREIAAEAIEGFTSPDDPS